MLVVFEVARCGASTQLRPDLASTVGPSEAGRYKGPRKYRPAGLLHSATSTGFFQQHRNTTTLCSSGWGCHIQKSKNTNTATPHGALIESRLIKPALLIKRNPTSSALVHNAIRGVETWTQNTNAFEPASSAASHLAPANTGAQGQA